MVNEFEFSKFSNLALSEAGLIDLNDLSLINRPIVEGYTIDSSTSKDLDDGINIEKHENHIKLQISISDVCSCVELNSELFKTALERVETRYLKKKNIPMLPKVISENKLSLIPDVLRPAITFEMKIQNDAQICDFKFKETSFLNIGKQSFELFDKKLELSVDDDLDDEIIAESEKFELMFHTANLLYEKRRSNGALVIYDLIKGIVTNEEGYIIPLKDDFVFKSYIVVQEFMILTNTMLAKFMAENDIPLLFRNHTIRQSAPDRNEILEQINTALLSPKYFDTLRQRVCFWFNKASYGRKIQGHYGLNEAAYTHITSPIRRVADLINHFQIKNYLKYKKSLFSNKELDNFCDKINNQIQKNHLKKEAIFKSIEEKTLRKKIRLYSSEELTKMDLPDYISFLKAGISNSDYYYENLIESLMNRFSSNNIDINVIYNILCKTDDEKYHILKNKALEYLVENKSSSIQLLNLMMQKNFIANYNIEFKSSDDGFSAIVTVGKDGNQFIIDNNHYFKSKKDASHFSATLMIEKIINNSDNLPLNIIASLLETNKVLNHNQSIDDSSLQKKYKINDSHDNTAMLVFSDDFNYVGILQEFCVKSGNDSIPEYQYKIEGSAHSPDITCILKIKTNNKLSKINAVANNKKSAKQKAAYQFLQSLPEDIIVALQKNKDNEQETSQNFIGLINEFCINKKLQFPLYQFKRSGKEHESLFECNLSIDIDQLHLTFSGLGQNKKMAKKNASEELWLYICKNNLNLSL